ncbi:MAG TPA: prepilin-type N-terminal cleavage/methylation domain-containing protein [Candidatus Baltobacteraceae bacterium]|nr:prepilin-type N-terminal cleavage/methylation domain-containing protein [Candidatus Baltobacteraceae bacterium]
MNKKQKGFSLIELLIVVAIILIIAAIAIPNLLRARMAANESSAVGSMRTINTANGTFLTTYNHSFAPSLVTLGGPTVATPVCANADLIDPVLSNGVKSGYTFNYTAGAADPGDPSCGSVLTYTLASKPNSYENSGTRSFFTDQTGVIRGGDDGGAYATIADLPLQ